MITGEKEMRKEMARLLKPAYLFSLFAAFVLAATLSLGSAFADTPENEAKIGETSYPTLAAAVDAANTGDNVTIELLKNITLGEKLTVSKNVTIQGDFTIKRADSYTGTFFVVDNGATLTLDGGMVIDGANEWTLNEELYNKALNREVAGVTWADLISSEENAPAATAPMFLVKGSVIANDVTVQNNYSSKSSNNGDYGIFKVEPNAKLTMTGAQIKHNVTGGACSVAHLSTDSLWTINDGTLISDNFSGKNGGVCRNDSGKMVMNGGTIEKNDALNTNGTVVMLYMGSMEMNGGKICSNTGVSGANNGRCAPIYGHSTSTFIMNGGEICHNVGISYGGVDLPSSIKAEIFDGFIGGNTSSLGNANADVNGNARLTISGGTFTQDVTDYLAPDYGVAYNEETGTYGLTKDIVELNNVVYNSLADAIADAESDDVVKVLLSHALPAAIVIPDGKAVTIDLNGKKLNDASFMVEAGGDLTVKNGEIVSTDSKVSAIETLGNLTATNVDVTSARHVLRVDGAGVAVIDGGNYAVAGTAGMTTHTLNASADAKVTIKNGTFVGPKSLGSDSGAAVKSRDNAVVTIENGVFKGGLNDTISGAQTTNVVIGGGWYDQDPSAYVVSGLSVIEFSEGWLVGVANPTMTFVTNGGSEVVSQTVELGQAFAEPAEPTRDGYTFAGWYTDENFENAYSFGEAEVNNITLYAKWTENSTSGQPGSGVVAPGADDSKDETKTEDSKKSETPKTGDAAPFAAAAFGLIALVAAGALVATRKVL